MECIISAFITCALSTAKGLYNSYTSWAVQQQTQGYSGYERDVRDAEIGQSNRGGGTGNVPNANTKIVTVETKAPNAMKASDVTQAWDDFLGPTQTNINPVTGQVSADRIFSADGTRSIRFSSHEMNSLGTPKGHFHFENWVYDSATDTMTINNILQRIIP